MSWLPDDEDMLEYPKFESAEKLKANLTLLCPILKCFTAPITDCYFCEKGFTGECLTFKDRVKKYPQIISEIYRPIPELIKQDLKGNFILYRKKLINLDKVKKINSLKHKDSLFGVTGRFLLQIRFIPKFEKVCLPFSDLKFFNEQTQIISEFNELVFSGETGNTLYSLNSDKKILDTLNIRRLLNE
jgi:hypothetical protein